VIPPPPKSETPTPSAPPIPPRWLFKLVELGLADEEVLTYLLVNARERKVAVESILLEQGIATSYQIRCVSQGRINDLQIGAAKVLDLIHEGTSATTYLVNAPSLEKSAALRLLHSDVLTSDENRSAYLEHIRGMMRFRHPSSASVLSPFEHEGRVGVVAEYVAGRSLSLAAASMTPTEVVACFRQCLAALFAGQRAGLLHRNLRPSQIMVSSLGRTVLLGFGKPDWLIRLERNKKESADDYYTAPEDRDGGRDVDARADLFSICRIFMEAMLGRRPSPGESIASPVGYPDAILELLIRGVQGDPAARCRSFAEVLHEVDSWLSGGQLTPTSPATKRSARIAA
jgi:serine/threonine protein kinase